MQLLGSGSEWLCCAGVQVAQARGRLQSQQGASMAHHGRTSIDGTGSRTAHRFDFHQVSGRALYDGPCLHPPICLCHSSGSSVLRASHRGRLNIAATPCTSTPSGASKEISEWGQQGIVP